MAEVEQPKALICPIQRAMLTAKGRLAPDEALICVREACGFWLAGAILIDGVATDGCGLRFVGLAGARAE